MEINWDDIFKQLVPIAAAAGSALLYIKQQIGKLDARSEDIMRRLALVESNVLELTQASKTSDLTLMRVEELIKKTEANEKILHSYVTRELQIVESITSIRSIDTRLTAIEIMIEHIKQSIK